jgi:hypothetical protein
MERHQVDLYQIGSTPEQLQQALIELRADFDSHFHDGTSSKQFETLQATTISAQTIMIRKTAYDDSTSGIWMGVSTSTDTMLLKLGNATNYLSWDGSTLNIVGSLTATSGTIGGWSIGASTLSGGGVTLDSSAGSITGALVRTSSGSTRVELNDTDNAFYLYESGARRVIITGNSISFLRPSDEVASGEIYGVGTNQLAVDVGDEVYYFDGGAFYPSTNGFTDLGGSGNNWNALYVSSIVHRSITQGVIYHGYCSGTTISSDNNSFTMTNPSTGRYTVTHNFGTTDYIVQIEAKAATVKNASIDDRSSNSFGVRIANLADALEDNDFMFIVVKT